MPKLTKTIVEAARPREKQFTIWCSDLSGFGAYVQPSGKRTYFVDYRNADGVRRRMTIGAHGKVTAEEARKLAIATLGQAVRGSDPAEERTSQRTSTTVKDLCDTYLEATERGLILGKGGKPKKASTLSIDRGRIERHIKPLLGSRLVRDLARADIARFIRDVTSGKTATVEKTAKARSKAVVEGGAGTAARTAGLLGGILSFAVSEGVIPSNPAQGVRRPADNRRQRRLTEEEYRRLGDALATSKELPQAIAGARLLALTGCRSSEITRLQWSEVDAAGGALRLEDSKEGRSVSPIGRAALDVLSGLSKRPGCPYVLPAARSDGPFGGMPGAWERIAAAAKLEGVTPHTLRHSFASVAGDLGFTESTIAAMLGHAANTVTSRYVHHLDSVLIAAPDKVARTVHGYMTGEQATVVELSRQRAER